MSETVETRENMTGWEEYIGSCVLLDKYGNCAVEEKYKCTPKDMTCPFHLTAGEKAASDARWKERMNALPAVEQQAYADTYYGGRMPWKDESEKDACGEADEN